jgi:cytochrome c
MQGNRSAEWAVLAACAVLIVGVAARASDIVADAEAGAETYNSVCKGSHGVSIAPTLRGVVGRPIASVASFAGYSDALKAKSSMSWTETNLDAFLTAPATFAPGTLMTQTIADAQQRADLIAYLAMLPPPR